MKCRLCLHSVGIVALTVWMLWITVSFAEVWYPKPDWKDTPNPIADPNALVGGEIAVFAGQYPKSLNYYLDTNVFTAEVFGMMYETLLGKHPITLEDEPEVADRWAISEDKKTFTFHIDPNARWSDGRPITARDVQWTFEAIMDPKHLTGVHKVGLERFEPPILIDDATIQFKAKSAHWKNLLTISGFPILPQHAFKNKDFNKINFEFPVVSGPYQLGKIEEGTWMTMERRQDWWQRIRPRYQGVFNFQTIRFRFYAERENAFEAFKKGLIDLFPVYTARIWINETRGEKFSNNWIVKQKVYNHKPVGFQGFAMNMRIPPFDDLNVRKAMAMLVDRRKMNHTLMYDQYFLHRSYWEDIYSKEHPCKNPLIEFDKDAARKLLHRAGYRVNPDTGYLEKQGKRFSFKFLTRSAGSEKFLSIFMEDLKDVGIEMVIDKKDWAAWARDMDEFNYQMTWAAWGASEFKDPEGMWASREADRPGGNNITGFKDPRIDRLIEAQKQIFDIEKRHEILRQIDEIIYQAYPYVLLWNLNYTRLLYWNKFGMPKTVLSKYGDERSAYEYWWIDEDSLADLDDAMETRSPLPSMAPEIRFDDVFK